ncbi:MAG TPA: Rieske 2Fe-2S domain-containing protein [Rubrobacter sp.]|nr:Rieske 2Fe-2S domain-containing protein [Rubrobacter sp.]
MPEELQKDPLSRGQFLWMGALGTFVGAALTIPPAIYVLDPAIKSVAQGISDVPGGWKELGSVFDVPSGEVVTNLVEFTQRQTYDAGQPSAEGTGANVRPLPNAVLLSWKDGKLPGLLEGRDEREPLTQTERDELGRRLNVMANACAHMGCPTRWSEEEKEIVCPCHGGLYDINGEHTGGPPPHGLWRYAFRISEEGDIFIKHEFHVKHEPDAGKPYVV